MQERVSVGLDHDDVDLLRQVVGHEWKQQASEGRTVAGSHRLGDASRRRQQPQVGQLSLLDRVEDGVHVVLLADGDGVQLLRARGGKLLAGDGRNQEPHHQGEAHERSHDFVAHTETAPTEPRPIHPGPEYGSARDRWDSRNADFLRPASRRLGP